MYRTIILKGTSQYNVLQKFTDELHQGFLQLGIHSTLIDTEESNWDKTFLNQLQTGCNFIVAINGIASDFKYQDKSIYNIINMPYVGVFVDHPYVHNFRLSQNIKNYIVTLVDKTHVEFLKRYYPNHFKVTAFLPHAGICHSNFDFDESYFVRNKNILFLGTFKNELQKSWHEIPNEFIKNLIEEVYCAKTSTMSIHEAFEYVIAQRGINFDNTELQRDIALSVVKVIDRYEQSKYRYQIIKSLLNNGYVVDVYGNGDWNSLQQAHKNLNYKGAANINQTLKLYTQYRITINDYSVFQYGSHERVFNSLANGCCCITTKNPYYDSIFQDKVDIVTYSPDNEDSFLKAVEYAIDGENAYNIVKSGKNKVLRDHLWINRAKTIVGLYELSTIQAS